VAVFGSHLLGVHLRKAMLMHESASIWTLEVSRRLPLCFQNGNAVQGGRAASPASKPMAAAYKAAFLSSSSQRLPICLLKSLPGSAMPSALTLSSPAGEELFQHIRDNGLLALHQVIFLTGDKSAEVKKFLESSGCCYIYKPFAMLQFAQQVEFALEQ